MYRLSIPLATLLWSGCFSTSNVPAQQLAKVQKAQRGKELILRDTNGQRVRVGPSSQLRFLRRDGAWTQWYRASGLRVSAAGVCAHRDCDPQSNGLLWSDVTQAQVKNLSGGKTYGVILATVIITAAAVAIIAGGARGLKLGGLGKALGRVGPGAVRGAARATRFGQRLATDIAPQVALRTVPADVGPSPVPVDPETQPDQPPAEDPPSTTPPPAPGATLQPTPRAELMFTKVARRRSRIRLIGGIEGGTDFLLTDGGNAGAFIGMRLADVVELGAGARMMVHRGAEEAAAGQRHHTSWIGFGRFNLHFDLDAARRVALPLGVDLGGGHASLYVRVNFGIRVRVARYVSLGLYPFNPTFAKFKDEALKRDNGWWSFPTNMDVAFAF
ncbi:MAG: hypothetical protein ABI333_20750 [bacterium]